MRNIITKILMTCMLAVFCVMAAAQDVVKLRTSEYALRFADDNGQWGEWSEWKVSSMPVVVTRNTIVIYSSEKQEYDVYESSVYGENSDRTIKMSAIGTKGQRCELRLRHKDDYWQLYVDYKDAGWVYNLAITNSQISEGSNTAASIFGTAMGGGAQTTSSTVSTTQNATPSTPSTTTSASASLSVDDDLSTFKRLIDYPMGLIFLPKNAEGVVGVAGMNKVDALLKQNRNLEFEVKESSSDFKYVFLHKSNGFSDSYKGHEITAATYSVGTNAKQNSWWFHIYFPKDKYSKDYVATIYKDMLRKLEERMSYRAVEKSEHYEKYGELSVAVDDKDVIFNHSCTNIEGKVVELLLLDGDDIKSYSLSIDVTPYDEAHFAAGVNTSSSNPVSYTSPSMSVSYVGRTSSSDSSSNGSTPTVRTRSINGFRVLIEAAGLGYDMKDLGAQFNLAFGGRFVNGHVLLGAGAGLDTEFDNFYLTPFAIAKYNVLSTNASPFVAVRPGYSLLDGEGEFYLGGDLGCYFRFNNRQGMGLSVTYVLQNRECEPYYYCFDKYTKSIHSLGIKIGFEL